MGNVTYNGTGGGSGASLNIAKNSPGLYPPSRNTIAWIGDSITNRNGIDASPFIYFAGDGFWTWAQTILMGQIYMPSTAYDKGVSGDTIESMAQRFDGDVLPLNAGWIGIQGGVNSITAGVSAGAILNRIEEMARKGLNSGARVVLTTVLPSTQINTNTMRATLAAVNTGLRNLATILPGAILCDWYMAWADPSTGDPAAGLSDDGTHPNLNGARVLGIALAAVLQTELPTIPQIVQSVNIDPTNLVYNGMANGNNASGTNGFVLGAGFTGTGPDGWEQIRSGTSTGTCSKVARSDYRQGSFQRIAAAVVGANETVFNNNRCDITKWSAAAAKTAGHSFVEPTTDNGFWYVATTTGNTGGAEPTWPTSLGATVVDNAVTWRCVQKVNPGESWFAQCEFATSGLAGTALPIMQANLIDNGFSTLTQGACIYPAAYTTYPSSLPSSGVLRTPAFVIPSSFTIANSGPTIRVHIRTGIQGAAGAAINFDLSSVEFRKLG